MSRAVRVFGLVALGALVGCAPNLSRLASEHHYREAICGARDGSSDDLETVATALDRDAAVGLHVRSVRDDELATIVGDAAPEIANRARFARVSIQTNALPVDGLDVSVELTNQSERLADVVSWESLARVTHESLPGKRQTETYATGRNVLRGFGAVFTLGISLVFSPFRKSTIEIDAPDEDYAKLAPHAHALYHAMQARCDAVGGDGELGASCRWYFAIPVRDDTPVRLDVKLTYTAKRHDRMGEPIDEKPCVVERTRSIELGDLGKLDATIARMFGGGMRPLGELAR